METTVIGSYPKPSYLKLPDWFKTLDKTHDTQRTNEILKNNEVTEDIIIKAIEEVIIEQKNCIELF